MMAATMGPAHRVQSAVVEYGYPRGHLGHLTDGEEQSLRDFKKRVVDLGLYKPQSESHEYGTHDDGMLLRYLRARRFNVDDALKQFEDSEEWRAANELGPLYETIDLEDFEETWSLYPQWTGRRDKRGIPVFVFEVRHLTSKAMAAYEKSATKTKHQAKTDGKIPNKLLRLFCLFEHLTRSVLPLSTALDDRDNPKTPITQSNNIVDISGVGLKQFWNLRSHMQDASTLATAHYPETLDRIFIIGAPSFFPTVWGWIKRWFDPITTSKIFIVSAHDVQSTLRQFIDPANIPKQYGGDLDFSWGGHPVADPAWEERLEWIGVHKEFPRGPSYWVDRGDKIELRAVGSSNGQNRRETVCVLKKSTEIYTLDNAATLTTSGNAASEAEMTPHTVAQPESAPVTGPQPDGNFGGVSAVPAKDIDVIEDGRVVSATRPEPKSFVTAEEGVSKLTLKEQTSGTKDQDVSAGKPHQTAMANALDPALHASANSAGVADGLGAVSSTAQTQEPVAAVSSVDNGADRQKKVHGFRDKIKEKLHLEK